jgi:TolB-like protein/thioredoxin-like negative regulator of GroEL
VGAAQTDRLDSWKEIAAYLNRSVRTVRRWEEDEALPVHRHMHRALGSVYAYKAEIDAWRKAATAAAAKPRPTRSIAVLPFKNMSAEPDSEYFTDGLTDEVIADLSKVKALRVTSRTSSMAFKTRAKDVTTVARELGVQYIVEGSVRRAGGRLRVTARLIDATADEHLWADKYDGTLEDVFAIQERLARMIVEALRLRLTSDEDRQLATRPIGDLNAFECYLQARQEAFRWRRDAIDHAVQLLKNGLAITGENAELYAALGRAYLHYREAGIDFSEQPLRQAEACVRKVLSVDPLSLAGVQLRGWIRYSSGQIQEAVYDLNAALDVDPNDRDTLALLSNCYLISGKVASARPLIARLLATDPLTPVTRCMPGFADLLEGQFASAVEPYHEMLKMDPGNPMARLFYAWVLALNGRIEEVATVVRNFPEHVQGTIPARLASFLERALSGRTDDALAALTPDIEAAANATDLFPRFLAHGYALAGMPDEAMHWLGIAVSRGFINYPFLARHDPFLSSLRGDPRFEQLLESVRERWQNFRTQ